MEDTKDVKEKLVDCRRILREKEKEHREKTVRQQGLSDEIEQLMLEIRECKDRIQEYEALESGEYRDMVGKCFVKESSDGCGDAGMVKLGRITDSCVQPGWMRYFGVTMHYCNGSYRGDIDDVRLTWMHYAVPGGESDFVAASEFKKGECRVISEEEYKEHVWRIGCIIENGNAWALRVPVPVPETEPKTE